MSHYARLFGYGEKAGLEHPGRATRPFPGVAPRNGGVGMLTSFGEEISQTPLQLAALMSAWPTAGRFTTCNTPHASRRPPAFTPRVKRHLEIRRHIRRSSPACWARWSSAPRGGRSRRTHRGQDRHLHRWPHPPGLVRLVQRSGAAKWSVVVLLTGGRPAIGPQAAGMAGQVYKNLWRRILRPDAGARPGLADFHADLLHAVNGLVQNWRRCGLSSTCSWPRPTPAPR